MYQVYKTKSNGWFQVATLYGHVVALVRTSEEAFEIARFLNEQEQQ